MYRFPKSPVLKAKDFRDTEIAKSFIYYILRNGPATPLFPKISLGGEGVPPGISFPQRLKPIFKLSLTARLEAVPFPPEDGLRRFSADSEALRFYRQATLFRVFANPEAAKCQLPMANGQLPSATAEC